jgi:hypothetical protein
MKNYFLFYFIIAQDQLLYKHKTQIIENKLKTMIFFIWKNYDFLKLIITIKIIIIIEIYIK